MKQERSFSVKFPIYQIYHVNDSTTMLSSLPPNKPVPISDRAFESSITGSSGAAVIGARRVTVTSVRCRHGRWR